MIAAPTGVPVAARTTRNANETIHHILKFSKRMKPTLCFDICSMRRIRCLEITEANIFALYENERPPIRTAFGCSKKSRERPFSGFSFVLTILRRSAITQIAKSIIGFFSVYVIDLVWPFAMHIKPRQAMATVFPTIDFDAEISLTRQGSRICSNLMKVETGNPRKQSGFRIVIQSFFKTFLSDNRESHFYTSIVNLVRGPTSVCALAGSRHFSRMDIV